MQLRQYQILSKKGAYAAFKKYKRVMLQLPTGGGKTVIFSSIANDYIRSGHGIIILVHRKELITQAVDKLAKFGLKASIIQSGHKFKPYEPLQVASVQTLVRRLDKITPEIKNRTRLIITDEAHHSLANSYKKIYEHYSHARHLGVTATPCRTNGAGFEDIFDYLVMGPSVKQLISEGFLVAPRVFARPLDFDLSGVKVTAGDYNEKALYEAMEKSFTYGDLVKTWLAEANGKKTILFALNVAQSKFIVDLYNQAGIAAEHVDGKTPDYERDRIMARFKSGKTKLLSNVGIVTEGFDVPDTECIQLVRPTKSLSLYLQMVGRGLRPADGKGNAIILDHANCVFDHGFPEAGRKWTLTGIKKERMEKKVMFVNPEGRIIAPREATKHLEGLELVEVNYDNFRIRELEKLIKIAKGWRFDKPFGYAWYHFTKKYKPTQFEISEFCKMAGYKKGWIKYKEIEFGYRKKEEAQRA